MTGLLAWLGRHATLLLAGGIFVGLALPDLARAARPLLDLTIFLTTLGAMIRVDWGAVFGYLRRPKLVAAFVGWKLVAAPALLAGLMLLLPFAPAEEQAFVLAAAGPPIMSSPVIAALLGFDAALALAGAVLATLLSPFVLPVLALHLLGIEIAIGVGPMILRMAVFIGGSLAVALVIQRLVGRAAMARRSREVAGLSVIAMLLFAVAIMDGVTDRLLADPAEVCLYLLAAFALNILGQVAAGLLFHRAGRRKALTAALMGGNSNMGLVLAGVGAAATPEFALLVAVGQFPIYMLPLLVGRLFPDQPVQDDPAAVDPERRP